MYIYIIFAVEEEDGEASFVVLFLTQPFCYPLFRFSMFIRASDHLCSRAGIASSPSLPVGILEDIICFCKNQRSLSLSTQGRDREDLIWVPKEIKIKQSYKTSSHGHAETWEKQGQLRLMQEQTQHRVCSKRLC